MFTTESVQLHGVPELNARLEELKSKFQRGALNAAARSGLNVIKVAIIENLRAVEHGYKNKKYSDKEKPLAEDIKVRVKRDRATGGVVASVGPRKSWSAYKAIWMEYGTAPHAMAASAHFPGQLGFMHTLIHPGQPPRPFMRPAFDGSWEKALEAFNAKLATAVEKFEKK